MPVLAPSSSSDLQPAVAGRRTLGELRSALLARLGMAAMGASGGANLPLIDSFLVEAQRYLYWLQDWKRLTGYEEIPTGVDQNTYDYPDACAQDQRVIRIEVQSGGQWTKLTEGITTEMWSTMDTQGIPARYERYSQLLVYPRSDAAYLMRVWYVMDLQPFTNANHIATVDDSAILLHATATAKAHYRQPDAKLYEGQLEQLVARIRGQSFGSNSVVRRASEPVIEPKPVLLGRDA